VLSSSRDRRPFGHNRHGPKIGELCTLCGGRGKLDPHVTQCDLGWGLLHTKWHLDPSRSSILLPLSFTFPSMWYICLVLAQNSHTVHTFYLTHQKYYSFINYALNHYQLTHVTTSRLNHFLCRRFIVCAVYLSFLNFLVVSSYSTFKLQECQ